MFVPPFDTILPSARRNALLLIRAKLHLPSRSEVGRVPIVSRNGRVALDGGSALVRRQSVASIRLFQDGHLPPSIPDKNFDGPRNVAGDITENFGDLISRIRFSIRSRETFQVESNQREILNSITEREREREREKERKDYNDARISPRFITRKIV